MTDVEMTSGEHLDRHIGRLVAFHRGRWYEVLAVGPIEDDERVVTVPSGRFDVLQQRLPPGATTTLHVFADFDYPVVDAPTDPAARAEMISKGHHLVRPAGDLPDNPGVPRRRDDRWHSSRGRAVDLPPPGTPMHEAAMQRIEEAEEMHRRRVAQQHVHWAFPDEQP